MHSKISNRLYNSVPISLIWHFLHFSFFFNKLPIIIDWHMSHTKQTNSSTIQVENKRFKPNSVKLNAKSPLIQEYMDLLKKHDIYYELPDVKLHPDEPMLGHTKGNTKSNRKKLKKHQEVVTDTILAYLTDLVTRHKLIDGIVYHYEYKDQ
jgi:hypothetical protein